jgi:hypothetical protein
MGFVEFATGATVYNLIIVRLVVVMVGCSPTLDHQVFVLSNDWNSAGAWGHHDLHQHIPKWSVQRPLVLSHLSAADRKRPYLYGASWTDIRVDPEGKRR